MKKLIFIILIASFLVSCQNEDTPQLDTPVNLIIYEDLISFDSVLNATSYIIEINGEEIEITDTFYPLVGYGTFNVRVKAKADGYLDSPYTRISSFVWLDTYQDVILNYSIHRTTDLFIYDFDESSYLQSLPLGNYTYEIYVSKGKFDIMITIIDTELPYITTHNTVTFNDNDLTFTFELFGGSILSLSGNNISIADYTIIDEELVIKRAYIKNYFISNPEETVLTITYNLQLGNSLLINDIIIRREEG